MMLPSPRNLTLINFAQGETQKGNERTNGESLGYPTEEGHKQVLGVTRLFMASAQFSESVQF
jgi:hypothetical protein